MDMALAAMETYRIIGLLIILHYRDYRLTDGCKVVRLTRRPQLYTSEIQFFFCQFSFLL
jgi:hypothetical protein